MDRASEDRRRTPRRLRFLPERLPSRTDLGVRLFSSAPDADRARRPTDGLLLIIAGVGLVLATLAAPGTSVIDEATSAFVAALPGLFGWLWEISYTLLAAWPIVLIIAPLAAGARLSLFRDLVLAGGIALGTSSLAGWVGTGDWPSIADGLWATGPPQVYPAARVAVATALVVTASPHLARPFRKTGRWIVGLGSAGALALAVALPTGLVAGLSIGFIAAATVHLILGSPGGRPTLDHVAAALDELAVPAVDLQPVEIERRGVALVRATTAEGVPLIVKVYGRDAWDGQLLGAIWNYLWYREEVPRLSLSRLQQVEHEAFVTLLAERAGVPVLPILAAGTAGHRDALLVVEAPDRSLRRSAPSDVTDAVLGSLWDGVKRMHVAGIAHGQLSADRVLVREDGTLAIADFGAATAAASDQLLLADRAQLLVTTSLLVGDERAVRAASGALGADALAETLPYLQPAALTPSTRNALEDTGRDLEDLRARAARAAGTDLPKLEQLRRVTWGSVLRAALVVAATYFLISGIAGLGLESIVDELRGAAGGWFLGALVLGILAQVAQGFSTVGASLKPIRLTPAVALQFAIQFVALAIPGSAARIAMNVRFFQRIGVPATIAVAIGGIDSLAYFLIQVLMSVVIVLTTEISPAGGVAGLEPGGVSALLVMVVVLAIVGIVIAISVPRFRRLIRARLAEVRDALAVLRSPAKLGQLFGGNLGAQLLSGGALGLCVLAFGYRTSLAEMVLINTLVSLLSGVLPVPGGIGVSEAALTGGLVAVGVPDAAALAAALMYRLLTFYLPPVWGAAAARWLKREGYL